jgi:hypothetical protein
MTIFELFLQLRDGIVKSLAAVVNRSVGERNESLLLHDRLSVKREDGRAKDQRLFKQSVLLSARAR